MQNALKYLSELENNNYRPWYHAHKPERLVAAAEFEALVQELIFRVSEFESGVMFKKPAELTYRLPRDVRMWRDKPPYNPSYRAHISPGAKHAIPGGYYICIQPGNRSFLSAGLYTSAFREATLMVREFIHYHPDEWEEVINDPDFADNFTVLGDKLKNIPREYGADEVHGEYLKHKSWFIEYPLTDEQVLSDNLGEFSTDMFKKMYRFNGFLNEALENFKFPENY